MARVWHNCGNRSVALRATVLAAGMLLGCTGVAGAFACNPCITLDNSIVGTGTLGVSGLNTTIPSSLGALRGANLFHSFALFNVPTGGMATFTRSTTTPQNTVSNIIARVTGGQSTIDGVLAVNSTALTGFLGNPSLYLINPSGVIFGANARLSVPGSFHVSTADYLRLGDCAPSCVQFSARPVTPDVSSLAPAAFGFLGPTPAAVSITQGVATTASLQVPTSSATVTRVLSVVGGPIAITGPGALRDAVTPPQTNASTVVAPRGRVQIVSVASAGEAVMTALPDINVDSFTALGRIDISGRAVIDASGAGSGTVLIRAGRLVMDNASILANTMGNAAGAARAVNLVVKGPMELTNGATVRAETFGAAGLGGDISATVGSLSLTGGSNISRTSQSFNFAVDATGAPTPTGGVTVDATGGTITVSGTNSGLFSTTFSEYLSGVTVKASSVAMSDRGTMSSVAQFDGLSGNISVNTGTLTATGGATIFSSALSDASAGGISVIADSVSLSGRDPLNGSNSSGIFSGSRIISGPPGAVSLNVGSLRVTDGAKIESGSEVSLQGGSVTVVAREPIVISDGGGITSQTARQNVGPVTISAPALTIDNGLLKASTRDSGKAGDIVVTLDKTLLVTNGGQIQSNTINTNPTGGGAGGNVTISAGESVSLAGAASGIFSTTDNGGNAGRIIATTPSLTLSDGAKVSVNTTGGGAAGDIALNVGNLTLGGGARIDSGTQAGGRGGTVTIGPRDSVAPSLAMSDGAKISVNTQGAGPAGDITLDLSTLTVAGGARIDSGTQAGGPGGTVRINAGQSVSLAGAASGVFSTADSSGNAGTITVTTPALTLGDGAKMSVTTQGGGAAGDIVATLGKTLSVTNGGQIQSNTTNIDPNSGGAGGNVTITANGSMALAGAASGIFSTTDNSGNAGRITATTPSLTLSDGAKISVTTQGKGAAGDIELKVGTLTLAGGARIDSGTSGAGPGGQVTITAAGPVKIAGAAVSSNATASGDGGNVTIKTPEMALTEHATISATSTGTPDANAGNIAVVIGNSLRIQNSAITTSATTADGGNISITTTGSQLYLLNGKITTSVQSGLGQGGNIIIGSNGHPVEFVILNGSEIRADAFGGPGGNIDIFAGTFLTTSSILSASSALGVPGTIGIQAGVTDVSSSVSQLPESVLQASTLLRAACATRLAGGQSSSLVVSGREGLPAEPGGVLPSPLVAEGPADSPLSLDDSSGHDDPSNRIALWVPAPRCLR